MNKAKGRQHQKHIKQGGCTFHSIKKHKHYKFPVDTAERFKGYYNGRSLWKG